MAWEREASSSREKEPWSTKLQAFLWQLVCSCFSAHHVQTRLRSRRMLRYMGGMPSNYLSIAAAAAAAAAAAERASCTSSHIAPVNCRFDEFTICMGHGSGLMLQFVYMPVRLRTVLIGEFYSSFFWWILYQDTEAFFRNLWILTAPRSREVLAFT